MPDYPQYKDRSHLVPWRTQEEADSKPRFTPDRECDPDGRPYGTAFVEKLELRLANYKPVEPVRKPKKGDDEQRLQPSLLDG